MAYRLAPLHAAIDAALPSTACLPWPGTLNKDGYGPYRLVYTRHRGSVPDGLILDHKCHTYNTARCPGGFGCAHRACVNPDHLEPVTPSENMRRGVMAKYGKVSSKVGWPLDAERCR